MSKLFVYNPTCIKELDGCWHAVKVDGQLVAWPGLNVYNKLIELNRIVPEHLQHFGTLPPLPDEDAEI